MGLNFASVKKYVRGQRDQGHCARFTGGSTKTVVSKVTAVTNASSHSRGHLLMLAAAARGIRKDVVVIYTIDDNYSGRVLEVTDKGVLLEGHAHWFDPRYLRIATSH